MGMVYLPTGACNSICIGYLVYSSYADRTNKADGIGHSAHLYGALWGILFFVVAAPEIMGAFTTELMKGPTMPGIFK